MIYIGILTVTTNVYGSRRTLRFGIVLDKKRKGIEDKIKETYRKKFEEKMQEVGLPASACKLSCRFETTLLADIDFTFFEDEATVKTFYKENGHIRLQPENSTMEPIIVPNCEILGKVAGVFRKM